MTHRYYIAWRKSGINRANVNDEMYGKPYPLHWYWRVTEKRWRPFVYHEVVGGLLKFDKERCDRILIFEYNLGE